jgi:exopolyphosphatase / guanosine-5'-triphosphate,3'-diphosphate pyrophosphatase
VKKNRLAAIDIGTNSIRCIVVEVDKLGKFRVLDDEKATVRLGEGIAREGTITQAAWQRAMDALSRMKKIVDGYGVVAVEAVATSAVRQATNGAAFVKTVADDIGLNIAIISGEEEAELAALSALHNFDMEGTRYAMVDIGGGSVEVVTALGNHIDEIYSLELGAVILTENFITTDPVNRKEYLRLRRGIRKTLRMAFTPEEIPVQCLLGSGGTMTSIAAMVMAIRKEEYGSIHGSEVFRSEVVHLLAMLMRKELKDRRGIPGLPPDRADIIVAGVAVVDELMELFKVNLLKINERGLREGLILKGLKRLKLLSEERQQRNWRDAAIEFARSCHQDEEHSRQVAKLAMEMMDTLAAPCGFGEKERQMLEAAALLHDVGYFISYSGHHKHSYHLIRHADLFGFTPREREIIAHVARYHRKSLPKKSHESYVRLVSQDRLLVKRLGGVLRLADGLDRRRNSLVTALDCSLSNSSFMVRVTGADDISVELFGGKAKGDLFEAAFGRKLILVPARPAEALRTAG